MEEKPTLHTFMVIPSFYYGGDEMAVFARARDAWEACKVAAESLEAITGNPHDGWKIEPAPHDGETGDKVWTIFQINIPDWPWDSPGVLGWDTFQRSSFTVTNT